MTHPTSWETFQVSEELNVAVRNPLGSEDIVPNHSLLSMIEKHNLQPHGIFDVFVAFCATVWNFLMSMVNQLVMVRLLVLTVLILTK